MNKAMLVGTISSEINKIDLRKDGATVSKFRLKTTETYSVDGELKERSQTHLIDCFSPYLQREIIPHLKEGDFVSIVGSFESRNIGTPDAPRWVTSISIRNDGSITVYGARGSNLSTHADAADGAKPRVNHHAAPAAHAAPPEPDLTDQVPF